MARRARRILLPMLCLTLLGTACDSVKPDTPVVQPENPPTVVPMLAATPTRLILPTSSLPPELTVAGRGLLSGEPCSPPCWEGITPGHSSEADVVRILDRLVSEGQVPKYTKEPGDFYWVRLPIGGLDITISSGLVREVILCLSGPGVFDYRVRQVIERFGEPEMYAPKLSAPDVDCSCGAWDNGNAYTELSRGADLLYPAQGVTAEFIVPSSYLGCVCPEMMVLTLYYYMPMSLTDAINAGGGGLVGTDEEVFAPQDYVEWHGYGKGY